MFQFILIDTIIIQQRLLVAKLQQTVREQQRDIDGLTAALRALKYYGSSDGCDSEFYADDDDSDAGSMTPGNSADHPSSAITISMAFFGELAAGSGVAVEAVLVNLPLSRLPLDPLAPSGRNIYSR